MPQYRLSDKDRVATRLVRDEPSGLVGVQTERFLIEQVNAVQSGNHIHSVLRDFKHDLGGDLLAEHHPKPLPDIMPGVAEGNTRKVSSATLDPGLGGTASSLPGTS